MLKHMLQAVWQNCRAKRWHQPAKRFVCSHQLIVKRKHCFPCVYTHVCIHSCIRSRYTNSCKDYPHPHIVVIKPASYDAILVHWRVVTFIINSHLLASAWHRKQKALCGDLERRQAQLEKAIGRDLSRALASIRKIVADHSIECGSRQ